MLTDIEIAQKCEKKPIFEIAKIAGVDDKYLEPYGKYKAKVDYALLKEGRKKGKLILVTAITPTPAGEGKTTTSIGLADGLRKIGKNTIAALREPSLGPVFGIKGGAAGGGYAQVVPMEDINLHFTGDFHAITTANNLLCALLDNSIQQGNPLGIDNRKIVIKRCLDMNDRQLRFVVDGLGGKANGTPREVSKTPSNLTSSRPLKAPHASSMVAHSPISPMAVTQSPLRTWPCHLLTTPSRKQDSVLT